MKKSRKYSKTPRKGREDSQSTWLKLMTVAVVAAAITAATNGGGNRDASAVSADPPVCASAPVTVTFA